MVRERAAERLDPWLEGVLASPWRELKRFAQGLRQDYAAVKAALTSPYSNGPTEGHVNRLKLFKRQMYGRAQLDLLRQRVLYAAWRRAGPLHELWARTNYRGKAHLSPYMS